MKVTYAANVPQEAVLKRVMYQGSDTIYEGMALCYNQDVTTNVNGANSGTTAEGSQNEGKYYYVEKPAAANIAFFAGVVARGSWCGTTGPRPLDIYVPNGAIVPARCTDNHTIGESLYLDADYEFTNVPKEGGYVGKAMETIDRSSTEGLVLTKLLPTALGQDVAKTQNNVTANSPVAVTVAMNGTTFTNTGAAGAIEYDLPTVASAKGCTYTWTVTDGTSGNNMAIDPNGSEIIKFGNGSDTLAAGEALTLTPGDVNDNGLSITLTSNGTHWVAKSAWATAVALFVIP
jgi:hypothetical protein